MDYMDQTVFNTPQPQASSTVERKRAPRRIIEDIKDKNDLDYLPVQEINESRASSRSSGVQSSLGLLSLDNIETFSNLSLDYKNDKDPKVELKDSALQMPHPTDSITEKYLNQRALALKALERADNHMKNKEVGGLPSYLLKSDGKNITNNLTQTKNESTINASDLERFAQENEKLSFNFNEISARSSSLSNDSRQGVTPQRNMQTSDQLSEYSLKCGEIFDKIRKSDVQLQQLYQKNPDIESLNLSSISTNSFNPESQDSLFLKLQNEYFTPGEGAVNKLEADENEWHQNQDTIPGEKDKNVTDFSRFSGYINDSVSMTDFFQQKCEKVEDFNARSPEKRYKPIPLIDLTNNSNIPEIEIKEPEKYDSPKMSESSVMSVTQIAKALEELGSEYTPRKVMDYLMNPKRFTHDLSKKTETLNTKENLDQRTLTPSQKLSISPNQKTLTPGVLTEVTNNFNKKTPPKLYDNEVITIDDSYENVKSQNNTLSSIKESPSISCSELQFSDDSTSSNEFQSSKDWFEIDNLTTYETCVLVESIIWLNLTSKSENWNLAEVKLESVTLEGQIINKVDDFIITRLPEKSDILKSSKSSKNKYTFLVQYMTFVVGHFELNLSLKMKDALSKMEREMKATLHVESERPDLNFKEKLLNFDVLPEESFKIKELSIYNNSKIDLVVNAAIVQENNIFCIGMKSKKQDFSNAISKIVLKTGESTILPIFMYTPDLESLNCTSHVKELSGKLVIYIENSIRKVLAEIDLIGRVGFSKIQFKTSCLPMILVPNQPKILNVKNSGVVTMELKATILELKTKKPDMNFTIEPGYITLKPSQSGDIKITYNTDQQVGSFSRVLKLQYENGPSFACDIEVKGLKNRLSISGSKSPLLKSRRSSGLSSPHRSYENLHSESPTRDIKSRRSLTALSSPHRSFESLSSPKRHDRLGEASPRRSYDMSPHKSYEDLSSRKTFGDFVDKAVKSMTSPSMKEIESDLAKILRSPGLSASGKSTPNDFLRSPGVSQGSRCLSRDICKSVSPTQSSASTDAGTPYLPFGKLPIESSRQELVWDCVKLGKSQTQEFIIRNKSAQKIRFNATINGIAYKIVKDQTELISTLRISLLARESRKILVVFTPNNIGAIVSKLIFTPIESCTVTNPKPQTVNLFGYGGHSGIDIAGVFKDTSGKLWLSFGKMTSHQNVYIQSVFLKNTGNLMAFYQIGLCLKPFLSSSLKIFPNEGVIPPGKGIEVSIRFTPKSEDFEFLRSSKTSDVFEVATLKLLTGTEASRGRLRKLHSKMSNAGLTCFSADLLSKLTVAFPGEHMPSDIGFLKEQDTTNSMKELFKGIISREITITLEEDTDLAMTLGNLDESCAFKSLCQDTHLLDDSHHERTLRRVSSGFCTVEPNKFVLSPPVKISDTILLYSRHSRPMSFEIETSIEELTVEPKIGLVQPGETTVLTVNWNAREAPQMHNNFYRPITADITVFCENQEINVKAHIIHVQNKNRMK